MTINTKRNSSRSAHLAQLTELLPQNTPQQQDAATAIAYGGLLTYLRKVNSKSAKNQETGKKVATAAASFAGATAGPWGGAAVNAFVPLAAEPLIKSYSVSGSAADTIELISDFCKHPDNWLPPGTDSKQLASYFKKVGF